MKNPSNPKERNLLKGALRRVFSRSELRRQALEKSIVNVTDSTRPRVKRWSMCPMCETLEPTYKMQVDHIIPLVPTDKTLEDFTWDELINRLWCSADNLKAICLQCHKNKTKLEMIERRKFKKQRSVK